MSPQDINVFQMVSDASPMVQFVILLLLFFSFTSWAIIFVKYRYIRRAYRESDYFTEVFWESRDFAVAFSESDELPGSPVARIFRIGYTELRKLTQASVAAGSDGETETLSGKFYGLDNVKRSLRRAINTEVTKMMQMVPFLATTGNTAPFIGLFGTVWGIMNSFHNIGQTGSASLANVAPGISEALIATAIGLGVAIPSVIAYNYFIQKINIIESELQSFSADFLNIIESDIINAKEKH